jgi:hypothetical protein
MRSVQDAAQAKTGRLLRVLFLWIGRLSPDPRAARLLSWLGVLFFQISGANDKSFQVRNDLVTEHFYSKVVTDPLQEDRLAFRAVARRE